MVKRSDLHKNKNKEGYKLVSTKDHGFEFKAELQRRSSKILEEHSTKRLLEVGNLYQSFTTLGMEPVSIVHYTRSGSSIKRPTPN